VAASWNYLIDRIFEKSDFALILNDDVYLGKQEAHIRLLLEQKFDFAVTPLDWCAYIIPKKTYEKVGTFDENFYPAYCEDCDYHLRMKKKGLALFKTPFLIPKVYRASMTMEKDPQGFYKANHNSLQYFKKKWGKYPEELL
jgi:GT2 family glycosyltransferase